MTISLRACCANLIAVLSLTACGPTLQDIETRDARIAALESTEQDQAKSLAECRQERANLETLVAGFVEDAKATQSEIDAMKKALEAAQARERQAEERLATFRSMLQQLKSMIDSGKLRVRIVRNRMVVELREAVLFESGKDSLSEAGILVLQELGPILGGVEKREFQVGGHTDNVPIQTPQFPSNWELSASRAVNVLKLLVTHGVPRNRISAAGYADTQPQATNETPEGRSQNRRIEIALLPNLDELPDLSALESVE